MPPRPLRRFAAALLVLSAVLAAGDGHAQLRPLDPIRWRVFSEGRTLSVEAGAAGFRAQRASLAGAEGDLWEVGNVAVVWRTGRVAIEAGGTVQRFFRERRRFAEPDAEVLPDDDGRRHDSGDWRIATVVRLTGDAAPFAAALRFGTRLPTTDNRTGLDRDATDFFATAGARVVRRGLAVSGEAGVGILGTRQPRFEQDDRVLYALGIEGTGATLVPSLHLVGQKVASANRQIRGNEDLGEVRLGLRAGGRRWVRVDVVRGYEPTSPSLGAILWVGVIR